MALGVILSEAIKSSISEELIYIFSLSGSSQSAHAIPPSGKIHFKAANVAKGEGPSKISAL
jgi:hypothetical protein